MAVDNTKQGGTQHTRTSIGRSKNSRPNGKNKRRFFKRSRGQGK